MGSQTLQPKAVQVDANRDSFLQFIYSEKIVIADRLSLFLSDKQFYYDFLTEHAPDFSEKLLPKSMGLGTMAEEIAEITETPSIDMVLEILHLQFPNGMLMKRTTEINSDGETIVFDDKIIAQKIINEVLKPSEDYTSELLEQVISGEEFLIQETVNMPKSCEFRVHTLGREIVTDATSCRWDHFYDKAKFAELDMKLQSLFNELPEGLIDQQAWGLDVFFDGTDLKIVDINSNRGEARQWSGDMVVPDVLGAYTRLLERKGYEFLGADGEALRNDQASHDKWVKKFGQEKVQEYLALKEQAMLNL